MDNTLIKKGKELSFLLRHDRNYEFDEHGYRKVEDLIKNYGFTRELIEEIVETNDKKRYEFNEDKSKIRARQGHSVKINVDLEECMPPRYLYHGTAIRFLESIKEKGLIKGTRNHVHLTIDKNTAFNTGKRHGNPVVLTVRSLDMFKDGYKFYLSNNGVWLTDSVPVKYIIFDEQVDK